MSQNNLINAVENWLLNYQDILEAKKEESRHGSRIVVSDAASRLAFIYEKIRNTVDYREDHLLRRYATARILRRIATPGNKGSDLARPLIEELIRARYLANNAVPEQMIEKVSHLINKYIVIYNVIIDSNYPPKEMKGFFNWLINLAACEVEEALVPSGEEKILVEVVERTIKQNLVFDGNCHLDEQGKNIQVYVAILKSLLKADEMTVNYFLLKYYFPEWHDLTLPEAERAAHDVKCSQGIIKENFNHHLNDKLVREFKKYTAVFWILQDIVQSNPEEYLNIFSKKEKEIMDTLSQIIWFGLAVLLLSGIGLYLPNASALNATPKFLVKMIIVCIIILNGAVMNILIAPQLVKLSFKSLAKKKNTRLILLRRLSFALGVISITSWYSALILGVTPKDVPIPFLGILSLYIAALIVAILCSQFYERYLVRMANNQRSGA